MFVHVIYSGWALQRTLQGREGSGMAEANRKTEMGAQQKASPTNCPGLLRTRFSSAKEDSYEKIGTGWTPYLSLILQGALEQENHHRVVPSP